MKETQLTISFLSAHGWTLKSGVMHKDFKDSSDAKYRIGWNIHNNTLYVGYGQLPCKVTTVEHLSRILDVFGYSEYADSLLD